MASCDRQKIYSDLLSDDMELVVVVVAVMGMIDDSVVAAGALRKQIAAGETALVDFASNYLVDHFACCLDLFHQTDVIAVGYKTAGHPWDPWRVMDLRSCRTLMHLGDFPFEVVWDFPTVEAVGDCPSRV